MISRRDEILASVKDVPAIPACVVEVLALAQNPATGIAEITDVMESDPGLTAEALRLANSAYFAGPRQVSSMRDAGVMFGVNRIVQLVLAAALFPITQVPIKGYDLPPSMLLRHLVAVGIGAEQLAEVIGVEAPQQTFTAGVLHDIGKIVLGSFLEVDGNAIARLANIEAIPFEMAERQVLGTDHAEAGAALLEYWQFPTVLVQTVRWHHHPERVVGNQRLVDLVHVADLLSVSCGVGIGIDGLNYAPGPDVVERLGLNNALIEKAAARMFSGLANTRLPLEAA